MYARYGGMKGNIVRGMNVIGERQKVHNTGKIAPTFITKALRNEPIDVYGGKNNCGLMDFVDVLDISKILIDALSHASYGNIFEAGTGIERSVWSVAEDVVRLTGSKSEIREVPMRSGESERSRVVADNPYPIEYIPFETTLLRVIEYYEQSF